MVFSPPAFSVFEQRPMMCSKFTCFRRPVSCKRYACLFGLLRWVTQEWKAVGYDPFLGFLLSEEGAACCRRRVRIFQGPLQLALYDNKVKLRIPTEKLRTLLL